MGDKQFPYSGMHLNGFLMLFIQLVILAAVALCVVGTAAGASFAFIIIAVVLAIVWVFNWNGFVMLEPNESMVFVFFGKYSGTFSKVGYHWVNPLLTKKKISLRIRNLDVEPIKVNDKVGNPIMIGLVLVWKIDDTYKAVFDLDSNANSNSNAVINLGFNTNSSYNSACQNFVAIQSDAALREVAGKYAYDNESTSADELTLRSGGPEINEELEQKLNERLAMAGITVVEARLNYLAYAPEIAAVMLRRQQASAIISAREKVVEGAVSMVQMALDRLEEENVVKLDNEKRASMVGNLLVVLCSDDSAQPVITTN